MTDRTTPDNIRELRPNEVFVFGSNLKNWHKTVAGAALTARRWGSGVAHAIGPEGRTYAVPTVDRRMCRLPVSRIAVYVDEFVEYAKKHPDQVFLVTALGTGLAGHKTEDIAPLFQGAVEIKNISLPESFWQVLRNKETQTTL